MKVKEESEKVGLKLNIQKTKIMASGPITSWQIDGETVEKGKWKSWLKTHIQKTKIMASSPVTSWQIERGKVEAVTDFLVLGSFGADGDCSHEIKGCLLLGRKVRTNLDSILKKQRHQFADKGLYGQSCGFSGSHVWMWEMDHKEGWVLKNSYFWTLVLENTLKSLLDSKEIRPVNPKANQSWVFIGRTDAEAEAPVLWPLMQRADSLEKSQMLGKIEGKKRRGWHRMRWLVESPTQWSWIWMNSGR